MAEKEKNEQGKKSILGMTPEELQEWLMKWAGKVPIFGDVARALERSRKRIQGQEIRPEEK